MTYEFYYIKRFCRQNIFSYECFYFFIRFCMRTRFDMETNGIAYCFVCVETSLKLSTRAW